MPIGPGAWFLGMLARCYTQGWQHWGKMAWKKSRKAQGENTHGTKEEGSLGRHKINFVKKPTTCSVQMFQTEMCDILQLINPLGLLVKGLQKSKALIFQMLQKGLHQENISEFSPLIKLNFLRQLGIPYGSAFQYFTSLIVLSVVSAIIALHALVI